MSIRGTSISDSAEQFRLKLTPRLEKKSRAEKGQYFSPPASAALLASLFAPPSGDIVLLDPGAGVGALTAAFVRHVLENKKKVRSLSIVAYEPEPLFLSALHEVLSECVHAAKNSGIKANYSIKQQDFINEACVAMAEKYSSRHFPQFTHAILNPPYKKINGKSATATALQKAGIETVNLYSAFVWLALQLLKKGGELSAITPRSFTNGPYFKPFRLFLKQNSIFDRVHIYEKRDAAFSGDEVLQENILFHLTKGHRKPADVLITQSTGDQDDDAMSKRSVSADKFIIPLDSEGFIHVTPDGLAGSFAKQMHTFNTSLESLGLKVSTGPVVDFRLRDFLHVKKGKKDVPLIYPQAFGSCGVINWPPAESRKPSFIAVNNNTKSWLVPQGCYVMVKRFSAKEERRRVVANVYEPSNIGSKNGSLFLGIENHLNFFHAHKKGMDSLLAFGLTAFLNSTLFDNYFRQFSGHTQVNSTDLRQILYPEREKLILLGKRLKRSIPPQGELDAIVHSVLNMLPETMSAFYATGKLNDARTILKAVNAPSAQINERSALCLLALANIASSTKWENASSPMLGITQMMGWFRNHYQKDYAPNTRETVRRQTMHQFVQMGLAIENPDKPDRPINSPKWCYQITEQALRLVRSFGKKEWEVTLAQYLENTENLLTRRHRQMNLIPVKLPNGQEIQISAGGQNELIKSIVEEFCPRFAPGGSVLYVGDAGDKFIVNEVAAFSTMKIVLDPHGKMPDVVVYHIKKKWLILIEAVTSHGPVDQKRRNELKKLFKDGPGLVFVTAFPNRKRMNEYFSQISWETEVWVAEDPSHMIHFNGERFLGPY